MDLNRLTSYLLAAAGVLAIYRLIRFRLHQHFPLLLAWLVISATESVLFGALGDTSIPYFWVYVILEPLSWLAAIAAAGELFALVFVAYPGIRTVGRWGLYAGITGATAVYILIASLFHRTSAHGSIHLFYIETANRAMLLSVAIVILSIRVVISRYPIQYSANISSSTTFLCIVFLSEAGRLLIDSMMPFLLNHYVDGTEDVIRVAATVIWSLTLRSADEAVRPPKPPRGAQEEHLLDQLKSVNDLLSGLGRGSRRPAARMQLR